MLEYHRTRKEAPQHQPQLPHDDTKYILHTCIVCGKGFKTDGGYKYHIANVCVLEPPPSATPVQANPPSALPDIVHQTTLSASALSSNTAHAGSAPFRPSNIPLVGTHGGEVGRMIGANTAEEDEDVAAVFNDI